MNKHGKRRHVTGPVKHTMTRQKRVALRKRISKLDREAAGAGAEVYISKGGILVATSAPAPLAYLRIRRNGSGDVVRSLGVESFHSKHLAQVLTHGTQDLDMRLHHVDDSELEAAKRAARVNLP